MSRKKEQTTKTQIKKTHSPGKHNKEASLNNGDNGTEKKGSAFGKILSGIIMLTLVIILDAAFVYGFDNADIRLFFNNRHRRPQLSDKIEMYSDITSADELIHSGVIQEGISIDEVDVSGMRYDKAVEEYSDYIKDAGNRTLRMKDSVGYFSSDFNELGIEVDVESAVKNAITYGRRGNVLRRYKNKAALRNGSVDLVSAKIIDENALRSLLQQEAEHMEKEPVNASITRKGDDFVINSSEKGVKVDIEEIGRASCRERV